MVVRNRERDLRVAETGSHVNYNLGSPPTYASMTHGLWEKCDDTIGNREGVNTFQKTDAFTHWPTISGARYNLAGTVKLEEFFSYPIGYRPQAPDPRVHWGTLGTAELNQYAWKILAETNPSVPHVGTPAFIGELKDLPSLVKGWGDALLERSSRITRTLGGNAANAVKLGAQGNLSWRWVVRPMISDLRKLIGFVEAVDRRFHELYRLRDGRTLRRRCHLGTSKHSTTPVNNHLFHSFRATLRGKLYFHYTSEVWGTAQWRLMPDSEIPQLGYDPLKYLARRLTFGITSHEALATAWELTPWSWLIDWFSNVGDIIAATNNSLGCTWSKVCLMRRMYSYIHAKIDPAQSSTWLKTNSDYVVRFERKERFPVFPVIPVPLPYLPIIDGGKLSILASLAALRR